jgi:hypothetical protein
VSPLPDRRRLGEIAVKGVHLGLRQIAAAPEQLAAGRLAKQAADRLPPPADDAKRVMFLTPRDWAAHVQWEGMIGQALRVRGADVHFVTCGGGLEICDRANTWEAPPMPCTTCRQYVNGSIDRHGFPRVALREGWQRDDPVPWPEIDELGLKDLVEVTDLGIALGELVDIPVKWFLMAAQTQDDPLAPLTYRRFLRSSRRVVRGLERALDDVQPDVVVLLNGLFFFEAICWDLCRRRGIDVVTYERGLIKETLLFRRGVAACLLDVTSLWERVKGEPLTAEEDARLDSYLDERKHGRQTIDRFWQDAQFSSPERAGRGRLAVLFTNLTWDSAVIGQEVAFPSIQTWVAAVIEAFAERPEHELIVRVHPAEVKLPGKQTREPIGEFLQRRFPELPANVRVVQADDPTSSYPLMEACDVGLVFTSTTGVELALQGKPVIVAGQSHYRDKGFTIDVSTPTELLTKLDAALADPAGAAPDAVLARRYANLFFFRAPIRSPGVEEHVLGLARLTVHDIDELRPGLDPELDRICDGILLGGDFTRPDDESAPADHLG